MRTPTISVANYKMVNEIEMHKEFLIKLYFLSMEWDCMLVGKTQTTNVYIQSTFEHRTEKVNKG